MKLKLLLLFLVVVGFGVLVKAQPIKPPTQLYRHLVITEVLQSSTPDNYVEFTNMGDSTINLHEFEFAHVGPWDLPWNAPANNHFLLPAKMLAPGESWVIATAEVVSPRLWFKDPLHNSERLTKPEMFKLANQLLYVKENGATAKDTVTPYYSTMDGWGGRECWFLRHHFIKGVDENGKNIMDSVVVDQTGGVFDQTGGYNSAGNYDVAGVKSATQTCVLIRKASVKTGNIDFANGRGLDANDSEWIPVPYLSIYQWRAVFWTVGNQAKGAVLDDKTLVSKSGKEVVDIVNGTITVPWGVRRKDSIMYRFERKPGLAWAYDVSTNREDSAYVSTRTGDILTLYVCGDQATIKKFNITVNPPTASDNIVIPKCGMNFKNMAYDGNSGAYGGWQVTDGVKGMDTIRRVGFATRVDTLFKYLEKPAKASWKIITTNNEVRPDLKTGDKLQVTSENGKVKEYFLKLSKFVPSDNAYLSSITWPDMPAFFKGDVAKSYGWAGDTIPSFNFSNRSYVVKIPADYDGIPALTYTKRQLNSKVQVTRAKTLNGTVEDRTVTFTVTAENDSTKLVYTVRFDKEKDYSLVQPWKGEPFFSQIVFQESWGKPWLEIVNPGTEPLDLSKYMVFCSGASGIAGAFAENNSSTTTYSNAYAKYVPGKKWQDEASWTVQPRILENDLAVNAIVQPGDVFVMSQVAHTEDSWKIYGKEIDVNFDASCNPWGFAMGWGNAIHGWTNLNYYLYKITNDSVTNGLKPTTDINDFKLIDMFGKADGGNISVGGAAMNQLTGYWRKPAIYKGNPEPGGSLGTDWDNSEWTMKNDAYYWAHGYGWPDPIYRMVDGIGSHVMDEVTIYRSTVSSKVLKVSAGYSKNETIKGVKTGTTVTGFFDQLIKANPLQTLTVKSTAGVVRAAADAVTNGDLLNVLSADSTNTSIYKVDVSTLGLSSDALLTSAKYTVNVTGSTATISGIKQRELLKNVVANVVVPAGATLTITDANDAYMTLQKLNYDSLYSAVLATDKVYFEVIAENGINKIVYQLTPTVNPSDAYATSDVYSVDQIGAVIQFVPDGTTVSSLLNNVYPSAGASILVYDKDGNVRNSGNIYRDDKLVVTSANHEVTKTYYFSILNFKAPQYLAFVLSDDYTIDQVKFAITIPSVGTDVNLFISKLYPSFEATVKVLNKNNVPSTLSTLANGDQLLVTAKDGLTTATYAIHFETKAIDPITESIKMYPNPTTDRVIIQGLTQGNRVQVFNSVGVTLRNVIVDQSTEYVSLAAQPAGIYIFVISSGDKFINIQKIVKK